jgi:ABC-type transporter Mla subunit MlaD
MNQNLINLNTRALITQAIQDVARQSSILPLTDPLQPVLDDTLNELAILNRQVVADDIDRMADTIGQHVGELKTLTTQITTTTADLQRLSDTLKRVADAVGFLLDIHSQAVGLGLLELLTPTPTAPEP